MSSAQNPWRDMNHESSWLVNDEIGIHGILYIIPLWDNHSSDSEPKNGWNLKSIQMLGPRAPVRKGQDELNLAQF